MLVIGVQKLTTIFSNSWCDASFLRGGTSTSREEMEVNTMFVLFIIDPMPKQFFTTSFFESNLFIRCSRCHCCNSLVEFLRFPKLFDLWEGKLHPQVALAIWIPSYQQFLANFNTFWSKYLKECS